MRRELLHVHRLGALRAARPAPLVTACNERPFREQAIPVVLLDALVVQIREDECVRARYSRWPTDPTWEVIQRAMFAPGVLPVPLRRGQRVMQDLERIDAEFYGLFKLRSVICER